MVQLLRNRDLEDLIERSKANPVLVFKHSTQCSISGEAYEEFKRFIDETPDLDCGLVLVIENRDVSNAIASRFGIPHQSPQAIVIKDGRASWHASHWSITADSLSQAVKINAEQAH